MEKSVDGSIWFVEPLVIFTFILPPMVGGFFGFFLGGGTYWPLTVPAGIITGIVISISTFLLVSKFDCEEKLCDYGDIMLISVLFGTLVGTYVSFFVGVWVLYFISFTLHGAGLWVSIVSVCVGVVPAAPIGLLIAGGIWFGVNKLIAR